MTSGKTKTRRRDDAQLKGQILAECEAPGAYVAKVAMSHGINDNVVGRSHSSARLMGPDGQIPAASSWPRSRRPCRTPGVDEVQNQDGGSSRHLLWPITRSTCLTLLFE